MKPVGQGTKDFPLGPPTTPTTGTLTTTSGAMGRTGSRDSNEDDEQLQFDSDGDDDDDNDDDDLQPDSLHPPPEQDPSGTTTYSGAGTYPAPTNYAQAPQDPAAVDTLMSGVMRRRTAPRSNTRQAPSSPPSSPMLDAAVAPPPPPPLAQTSTMIARTHPTAHPSSHLSSRSCEERRRVVRSAARVGVVSHQPQRRFGRCATVPSTVPYSNRMFAQHPTPGLAATGTDRSTPPTWRTTTPFCFHWNQHAPSGLPPTHHPASGTSFSAVRSRSDLRPRIASALVNGTKTDFRKRSTTVTNPLRWKDPNRLSTSLTPSTPTTPTTTETGVDLDLQPTLVASEHRVGIEEDATKDATEPGTGPEKREHDAATTLMGLFSVGR